MTNALNFIEVGEKWSNSIQQHELHKSGGLAVFGDTLGHHLQERVKMLYINTYLPCITLHIHFTSFQSCDFKVVGLLNTAVGVKSCDGKITDDTRSSATLISCAVNWKGAADTCDSSCFFLRPFEATPEVFLFLVTGWMSMDTLEEPKAFSAFRTFVESSFPIMILSNNEVNHMFHRIFNCVHGIWNTLKHTIMVQKLH